MKMSTKRTCVFQNRQLQFESWDKIKIYLFKIRNSGLQTDCTKSPRNLCVNFESLSNCLERILKNTVP